MQDNEINYVGKRENRQGVEILLRAIESGVLTYADIYSIKFVTISPYPVPRTTMPPQYY